MFSCYGTNSVGEDVGVFFVLCDSFVTMLESSKKGETFFRLDRLIEYMLWEFNRRVCV